MPQSIIDPVVGGMLERMRSRIDDAGAVSAEAHELINFARGLKDGRALCLAAGALPLIFRCLAAHSADATVCEVLIAAVGNLTTREVHFSPTEIGLLVGAFRRHRADARVCETAVAALINATTQKAAVKVAAIDAGAEDLLVEVLTGHAAAAEEAGSSLVLTTCRAIYNLMANCERGQVAVIDAGGVPAVVATLRAHRRDADVCVTGSMILADAACTELGRYAAAAARALPVLVTVLREHAADARVCKWAAMALVNTQSGTMVIWTQDAAEMGQAVAAAVDILRIHADDVELCRRACLAIINLCVTPPSPERDAVAAAKAKPLLRAVPLLKAALTRHGDACDVAQRALQAIGVR